MKKPLVVLVTTATASNKTAEENLGLGYIAAVCRKENYDVDIIDGWLGNLNSQQVIDKIQLKRNPVLIGFSCNQLNGITAIEIVKELKKQGCNVPFVAGGFAPTFNPEKFLLAGFDYVTLAEGEYTTLKLLSYLQTGRPELCAIPGICYLDENSKFVYNAPKQIENINSLPFPSRDTMHYVIESKTPVNLSSSRGCMAHCLFCSVAAFERLSHARNWRDRSIKSIVDEMELLYNCGARHFKFVDDSFIEGDRDESWCNEFADEIAKRKMQVKLRITLRADRVTDGIIAALTRAGCNLYACGIENFCNSALQRMGKKATVESNINALDIFLKHGVYVQMGFILFDHGTTFEELVENYKLLQKYDWTICRGIFSEMYAARGTPYTQLLMQKGLLTGDARLENYQYTITDEKAYLAYQAIKKWHMSHMRLYNTVIEPINKPKVLDDDIMAEFYELYLTIRSQDLNFFRDLLNLINKKNESINVDDFVDNYIHESHLLFENKEKELAALFKRAQITYMADEDPFTC